MGPIVPVVVVAAGVALLKAGAVRVYSANHYETKSRLSLADWEKAVFANSGIRAEYESRILPTFARTVDTHVGESCTDIATSILKALATNLGPWQLSAFRVGVGAIEAGSGAYAHEAVGLTLANNRIPIAVLDPINMALGGQDNTAQGAYYRWPASHWRDLKSKHYGGDGNAAAWHGVPPGAYKSSRPYIW